MPYIFLYLPAYLVQDLTHEMCTEIILSREDKVRGTQGIRASSLLLIKHFQLLLVQNLTCVPGLHVSMALTHFLAAEILRNINKLVNKGGKKRSPHNLHLLCSIIFKDLCLCYHFNSLVYSCAFSLICLLVVN